MTATAVPTTFSSPAVDQRHVWLDNPAAVLVAHGCPGLDLAVVHGVVVT